MHLEILFIGNSHTYLHKMPWMIADLASAGHRGHSLYVEQCTGNGVNLKWHWRNKTTRDAITARQWDFVVLQDRSGGPLEEREVFDKFAGLLTEEIKQQGAVPLLYMTWARRSSPRDQTELARVYTDAARRLKAGLVPVGIAWQKAIHQTPTIDLYHPDGRHAGPAGAYLTACVFYSVLFGTTSEGLPSSMSVMGKQRVDLEPHQALPLQRIACQTARQWPLPPTDDTRHHGRRPPCAARPETQVIPASIRKYLEDMRLETVAAHIRKEPVSGLDSLLETLVGDFRAKARQERSIGEIPTALCLERRVWALAVFKDHGLDAERLIRPVDFEIGYNGKILMIGITGKWIPETGRVCLRSGDDWHYEILKNTETEVRDLGFETAVVTPLGGTRVRFEADKVIVVHGTSDLYGACDKKEAARIMTRAFPEYTINILN